MFIDFEDENKSLYDNDKKEKEQETERQNRFKTKSKNNYKSNSDYLFSFKKDKNISKNNISASKPKELTKSSHHFNINNAIEVAHRYHSPSPMKSQKYQRDDSGNKKCNSAFVTPKSKDRSKDKTRKDLVWK